MNSLRLPFIYVFRSDEFDTTQMPFSETKLKPIHRVCKAWAGFAMQHLFQAEEIFIDN